jgi:chromatin assembly factor 1 subunit A
MKSNSSTVRNFLDYDLLYALNRRHSDTPYPIDPFMFVSSPEERLRPAPLPQQELDQTSTEFVVPALPPHVLNGTAQDTNNPKKPKLVPKSTFPEAHITYLCDKVAQMRTGSLPVLVDAIYQDLRVHKVKKNAIEAKIREVCSKDARGAIWAIKSDQSSVRFITSSTTLTFIEINLQPVNIEV